MTHPRITFIGAGNMATSLIGGLLAQGIPASHIRASDPGAEQRAKVAAEFGIELFESNAEAIAGADVVVLATKPQVLKGVSQALAPSLQPGQLIVSIAAGITCASLASWLGDVAIVRCMPNTPALLRQGVSGLYANAKVSAAQRQQAEQLLSAVGLALWLDEEQLIDAVTAVSGSGPAYVFALAEAMEDAALAQGLPADAARQMVVQTVLGAARMLAESGQSPTALRTAVTSPNGTTQAALETLAGGDFHALVGAAVAAATQRGRELAGNT